MKIAIICMPWKSLNYSKAAKIPRWSSIFPPLLHAVPGVVCKGGVRRQGEHAAVEQGRPADQRAEESLGQTLPERGAEGGFLVRPRRSQQAGCRGEGEEASI